jgi:hypothetical protein
VRCITDPVCIAHKGGFGAVRGFRACYFATE